VIIAFLIGALIEGIKERLLGPEINLEFFLLTVRAYAEALLKIPAVHTIISSFKFFGK
jgi:hypothetical protein